MEHTGAAAGVSDISVLGLPAPRVGLQCLEAAGGELALVLRAGRLVGDDAAQRLRVVAWGGSAQLSPSALIGEAGRAPVITGGWAATTEELTGATLDAWERASPGRGRSPPRCTP